MKIKSPFKDYYDYISHQYGGGDPKIVYIRDRIVPLVKIPGMTLHFDNTIDVSLEYDRYTVMSIFPRIMNYRSHNDMYYFKWLIINGKQYTLISNDAISNYELLTKEKYPDEYQQNYFMKDIRLEYISKDIVPLIVDISKIVNTPVFIINAINNFYKNQFTFRIESRIPKLSDYNIPHLVPPQQMYQDISYFISNVMKNNPDINPPAEVSEKDRIIQHGFDLKTSFRHPVK